MTENSHQPPPVPSREGGDALLLAAPTRRLATGVNRCYVRMAVLGDETTVRSSYPGREGWPQQLAAVIGADHDVSWCDARERGATVFDVRRVQLRIAVAHRPHVVILAAGAADVRDRDWDASAVREHLLHCTRVLTQRGALVLTAGPAAGRPGVVATLRGRFHRSRARELEQLYGELHDRLGTIHLDPGARPDAAELAARFARELSARGLTLRVA